MGGAPRAARGRRAGKAGSGPAALRLQPGRTAPTRRRRPRDGDGAPPPGQAPLPRKAFLPACPLRGRESDPTNCPLERKGQLPQGPLPSPRWQPKSLCLGLAPRPPAPPHAFPWPVLVNQTCSRTRALKFSRLHLSSAPAVTVTKCGFLSSVPPEQIRAGPESLHCLSPYGPMTISKSISSSRFLKTSLLYPHYTGDPTKSRSIAGEDVIFCIDKKRK